MKAKRLLYLFFLACFATVASAQSPTMPHFELGLGVGQMSGQTFNPSPFFNLKSGNTWGGSFVGSLVFPMGDGRYGIAARGEFSCLGSKQTVTYNGVQSGSFTTTCYGLGGDAYYRVETANGPLQFEAGLTYLTGRVSGTVSGGLSPFLTVQGESGWRPSLGIKWFPKTTSFGNGQNVYLRAGVDWQPALTSFGGFGATTKPDRELSGNVGIGFRF